MQIGLLSRLRESDAEQLAQATQASLSHLQPFMPWATPEATALSAQQEYARLAQEKWDGDAEYIYLLRHAAGGPVLGSFGLHRRIEPDAIEIGYWLHVDHVGHGYATAAAGGLTKVALAMPDINRVEIHTDEANVASAAIPRRLGYRLDRVDVGPPETKAATGRLQIWIKN